MLKQLDSRTPAITIGQGDTAKLLKLSLSDCGRPIDLTGSAVVLRRKLVDSEAVTLYPMAITDATNGGVSLSWPANSNDMAGDYQFQIAITDNQGKVDTHPKGKYGYELMRILPAI